MMLSMNAKQRMLFHAIIPWNFFIPFFCFQTYSKVSDLTNEINFFASFCALVKLSMKFKVNLSSNMHCEIL